MYKKKNTLHFTPTPQRKIIEPFILNFYTKIYRNLVEELYVCITGGVQK